MFKKNYLLLFLLILQDGDSLGVRAPLDLGGGDLIARKHLHHARKHVSVYKRTQTAVKTKRSHFWRVMNIFSFPIFGTSKGNEHWFEK